MKHWTLKLWTCPKCGKENMIAKGCIAKCPWCKYQLTPNEQTKLIHKI